MGNVIGALLPLALGVAISPVPIIAVILMLLAPKAKAASVAFMIGWGLGITVVITLTTFLLDPADSSDGGSSSTSAVIKIVIGVLAVLLSVQQWRSRPGPGETAALPSWVAAIDKVTPLKAAGLGALLSGLNPKNLALCIAGGAIIGGADLPTSDEVIAIVVFVVIGSVTVAGPVLAFLVASERLRGPLDTLRVWLTANNATVMSVLLLVIGVAILGKGIGGL
jgi:threonine/homoserine/homoserine lactone efflux protein